ncbi:hypothetical protein ACOSP7_004976 [Xanthoceras sorbifolium]
MQKTKTSLSSSVTDKSPKDTLDVPIVPFFHVINGHPDYFTTSLYSGRIPSSPTLATAPKAVCGSISPTTPLTPIQSSPFSSPPTRPTYSRPGTNWCSGSSQNA